MKYKIVYSKKLYEKLADRKVYPVKMSRNLKNPRYFIWFYEPTEKFMEILNEYKESELN